MITIDLPPSEYRRVPNRPKLAPQSGRWSRVRGWLWDVKWVIAAILLFLGWVVLGATTAGYVFGMILIAAIQIVIVVRLPWIWAALIAFGIGSE